MTRPPIKPTPKTSDKREPKPNREAILTAQATVDSQLSIKDSADNAVSTPARDADGDTPGQENAELASGRADGDERAASYDENKAEQERHEQRLSWFYAECSRQAANRREMAKDEAFYDSEQWDPEDEAAIRERGQKPVVYNEVKPTVDFLIGTEARGRVDFFVVANDDDPTSSDEAIAKTKLLKYLEDVNRAPFERSQASKECFKAGLGVLEVGLRGDKTGVPIFIGAESWRNFVHDSRAKPDQSDARYNFRVKEVDLDVACALFPDKEEALKMDAVAGDEISAIKGLHGIGGALNGLDTFGSNRMDDFEGGRLNMIDVFNARQRVTIIECWSREPVRRSIGQGGMGDPIEFRVRVALMTETTTLLEAWSPFKHDRFPFILLWCYRNSRTGLPYGIIRPLRGPQEGLNRRMTRAIFESSFNQLWIEEGALNREIMDEAQIQQEANDPTGVPIFANGALSGNKVRQPNNPAAGREQIMLAEADRQTLRSISSVNEENRGLHSQATSRVAMDAKAERGSIGVGEIFDNLLLARQQEGEIVLSLCEQFVVEPMTIRVAGESGPGNFERTKINQPAIGPDGQPTYLNDISREQSHFVVGEQMWKQSYAESAFGSLMETMTQLASSAPQVVINLLDVVFDMHPNLPRKKVVVERIRSINGQTDPDGKVTPEQAQQRAQQQAVAQAQFQLQMANMQAEVAAAKAKGEKLSAETMQIRMTSLYEAAQAAQVLALAPGITPVADQLLASIGYVDQSGSPQTIDPSAVPAGMVADPTNAASTGPQGRMRALMPPGPPQQLQQSDGRAAGIETMRPDGVRAGA